MIYYTQIEGAVAPEGARQLVTTAEGRAMGRIPGWRMLLDPSELIGSTTIRNRALRTGVAENSGTVPVGEFSNGEDAFEPVSGTVIRAPVNTSVNATEWTMFCVMQFASSPIAQLLASPTTDTGEVSFQIGFSAGGGNALIYSEGALSGAAQRLSVEVDLSSTGTTPQFFMFTGSTRDGLKIYRNGSLIASDSSDTRALDTSIGANEWEVLRGCRGLWGMIGLLDIDLGWSEYAPYRRQIERFMREKYDITAIPA